MLQKRSDCYDTNDYRVVIFGDAAVGKTSLLLRFIKNSFREHYSPTVEDTYCQVITCDNAVRSLHITDTGGSHSFPAMSRLAIQRGHAFILVFSLTNKKSFERLHSFYMDIIAIKKSFDKVPLMLVGNKFDSANREVEDSEALKLAKLWKCAYIETSASQNYNARELFVQLLLQEKRQTLSLGAEPKKSKSRAMGIKNIKSKCIIM